MMANQVIPIKRSSGFWSILKGSVLTIAYLFATYVSMFFLEPGSTPPGFTGEGAYAIGILLIGAFHLAGTCQSRWVFLLFGGLGAMLLLPHYFYDGRMKYGIGTYTTFRSSVIGWSLFVLTVAFLCRAMVKLRGRIIRDVPREDPLCKYCGYDLRATQNVCPECGHEFDLADYSTYVATVRHWEFRWLVRLALKFLLLVVVPLVSLYGLLYWRSEQPAISTIRRMGAIVDIETSLPAELQLLPRPIQWLRLEELFSHATSVIWRGQSVTDEQLVYLKVLPELFELHFENTSITGSGLASLRAIKQLQHLYVSGSAVDNSGLKDIASLWRLTQLQLTGTKITDTGLKHLQSLQSLEYIWLEQTAISDQGLMELGFMPNLKFVELTGTRVTKKGIRQFRSQRPLVTVVGPDGQTRLPSAP